MVNGCWAKCLGDCRGKITAEHIVTEKIWRGDDIGVFGLPWCREKHLFIGVANFTSVLSRSDPPVLSKSDPGRRQLSGGG